MSKEPTGRNDSTDPSSKEDAATRGSAASDAVESVGTQTGTTKSHATVTGSGAVVSAQSAAPDSGSSEQAAASESGTSDSIPAPAGTASSGGEQSEEEKQSEQKVAVTADPNVKDPATSSNSHDGTPPPMTPVTERFSPPPIPRWRNVNYPRAVLPAAAVAGVAAAVTVPWDRPGLGWVLAGAIAAGAVFEVDRRARQGAEEKSSDRSILALLRRNPARLWWTALALALLAVGAVRAAGWLFALCLPAAVIAGSLAVVPRRSVHGLWYDAIAVPLETASAALWVYDGARRLPDMRTARTWRAGLSVAATIALLAVFAPLLGSADATFGSMLNRLIPTVEAESLVRWTLVSGAVALGCAAAMFLLAGPPMPANSAAREAVSRRTWSRWEWALPVGALTALFAAFVAAQFAALFGGDDYVQETAGLTYAEYARSGFWQLSIVTMLALAVILAVLRWAAQDSARDRTWLRALLGAVSTLSLVLVASAFGRMWTYQQAYGFTVLRLLVEVCELWLGLIYLLVLVAVVRLRRAWLPRAAVGTAFATLLALAILNPERLVAERNIDRWVDGKRLDTEYLSRLSPDVVPALDRLPEPTRLEVLGPIREDLPEDTWQSWNLSRAVAR
ncbi:DUF4173 domain-containing protein [Nocardia sp. NPDC050793]|uniref:DUF4153 domain-containing protein n=1 Tax=Nocardia sp. NPDC050793 TaxID=3155159 RepID=UPI0033DB3E5E